MAKMRTHVLLAASTAAAAYLVHARVSRTPVSWQGLLLSALLGAMGGSLPDLAEPALHPGHRAFFHSITAAALLMYGCQWLWCNRAATPDQKCAAIFGALGYATHLIADGLTPKGLPAV